jgi:Tfp pilus assembly protein PilX
MAPPPAATGVTARRHGSAAAAPAGRREAARPRRVLRIVPARPRKGRARGASGRPVRNRGRVLNIISVSLVVAALLAVVVAQALLANGQVRLSALQQQLSLEQSAHRQSELSVSELETPARIVGAATSQLHMVRPANVIELPYVSLQTPLPTPNVTPAPPAAAAPASGSGLAGSAGSAGSAVSTSGAAGTSGTSTSTATSTP